jgi:hypothetical protein
MSTPYYSRRLTGPIVLITIGVLFLIDQVFPYHGWGFGHTWPVILIVIGACKIFERFFAPSNPPYAPPPTAGPGGPSTSTGWQAPPASPGSAPAGNEPPKI